MAVNVYGRHVTINGDDLRLQQIRFTNEVGHKAVVWLVVELPRRADLSNGGVPHNNDFIRDGQRFFLIVGHIDHGQPEVLLNGTDVLTHLAPKLCIQIRQRLVEKQNLRLKHQGARNCDTLLLPAGQLGGQAAVEAFQSNQFKPFQCTLARLFLAEARESQTVLHVFQPSLILQFEGQSIAVGGPLSGGYSTMRFFFDILLPMSRTNIAALFVILFIYGWNQYLWPLLITTDPEMNTIVMGIKQMFPSGDDFAHWPTIMATSILAMIPPVLVVIGMQKLFIRGLVESEK